MPQLVLGRLRQEHREVQGYPAQFSKTLSQNNKWKQGWRCGSAVERLPAMLKGLVCPPALGKGERQQAFPFACSERKVSEGRGHAPGGSSLVPATIMEGRDRANSECSEPKC